MPATQSALQAASSDSRRVRADDKNNKVKVNHEKITATIMSVVLCDNVSVKYS